MDSSADVVVDTGGTDSVLASVNYTLTDASGIEWLVLSSPATLGAGNSLANTLVGTIANESLFGGVGNDSLLGGGGNDTLNGGTGNDSLTGGTGDDYYIVDSALDIISDASGTDSVEARINYTLGASSGMEWLILRNGATLGVGNSLYNTLLGDTTSESLNGGDGSDSIFGGGGNDTLNGGAGNDSMTGGSGNDYYIIDSALDSITDANGTDSVLSSVNYTLGAASGIEWLILNGSATLGAG
ncbi:MAG: calcium-binding protein, partial [Proteobacteria bacterium]|nr:calcium-binding protein [Pseudomonadota bacterium]